jgi:thiol-disulfide isomerase/thioredoxin
MPDTSSAPQPVRPSPRRLLWRALPSLVLAALLVGVLAAGVLKVKGQVEDTGSFTVADQEAIEGDVPHRPVEITGTLLADGATWASRSARGSVLVVNFWASWCGPCRAEQPILNLLARAYRDQGVRLLGINVQDNQAAAKAHVREFKIPYPSLFDPGATTATTLQAFALPTTFLLDRDGIIAYRLTGKTTAPILSARLDKLLASGGRWTG